MTSQFEQHGSSRPVRTRRHGVAWTIRISPAGVLLLAMLNLAILGGGAYGISRLLQRYNLPVKVNSLTPVESSMAQVTSPGNLPTITPTNLPSVTSSFLPSATPSPEPSTSTPQPVSTLSLNQGLLILAVDEGGNKHLFAYQPEASGAGQPLPLTRLTYGPWDDITPAISPDSQTVAFASNRSGYWDIYLMNLASGGITRLTDTLAYDAAPSWSPDGKWLAYETYLDDNLELMLQSIVTPGDVIRLTNNQAGDFSPAWSPRGRQIAYVSNQSGEDEIWLADLDQSDAARFQNISQDPGSKDTHPAWSPDGSTLAWVGEQDGMRNLFLQEIGTPAGASSPPPLANRLVLGSGDWPAWSIDGETILTILRQPNHTYLTAYPVHFEGLGLPTLELPGEVYGLSWGSTNLAPAIQTIYQKAAEATSTPLYVTTVTAMPGENGERYQLAQLNNVDVPQPYLHDMTDESFSSLRKHIAAEAGWDVLSSLENAFVPLTSPLDPGMGHDWLYTGRAFALNTLPMNAGWMAVVREDFGVDTYWRVYIRALYQDGSAGIPLHDQPWEFDGRYSNDTTLYEQGGMPYASIPAGYWIDFTQQARAYGWDRLPALVTWRAFYPAARFNEFALTGGLTWQTAMLELYPPEVLITPTAVVPPTRTPTPTSRWYVSPTPTNTATPRPTFTPVITVTATPGG